MPIPENPNEMLLEVTQIPTAAGREQRVIAWIERWAAARPGCELSRDSAGNLVVQRTDEPVSPTNPPIYITAHMDHPAFVVERVGPDELLLGFRGGVMADFFEDAPVRLHRAAGDPVEGVLTGKLDDAAASAAGVRDGSVLYSARFASSAGIEPGDIATWDLPDAKIDAEGIVHTHACDDLAALVAALVAFERLLEKPPAGETVRLLFTRAEEIGFIGAIAACKLGTMPAGSRVIALENSRASSEAPIGGGPIVRVGDRLTVFSQSLTGAIARRAEELTGRPAVPRASEKRTAAERPWQRKLMSGGACEATVFCAHRYEATCLCLPLGNYHNMAHLDALQAGTYDAGSSGPPRAACEFIAESDFRGLVDLLVGVGEHLPPAGAIMEKLDGLHRDRAWVLGR